MIVLAHRRVRLAVVGLAIAVAGAVCSGLVWFGGETAAAESPVSPTLVRSTYDARAPTSSPSRSCWSPSASAWSSSGRSWGR